MTVGAGDFGADVRADAGLFRGHVEAGGAGDVVAVEDREGREVERGGASDQFFGDGGAFEKAEGGAGVELDIVAVGLVIGAFDEPVSSGSRVDAIERAVG